MVGTDQSNYPVCLTVDYPQRQSRLKALFRLPLSFPVLIFTFLLQGGVAPAIWAAILVQGHIPAWLFDFQVGLNRWQLRASSYLLLLTDEYPPFEGRHTVNYDVQYPERLSRWKLVIWKFITSIPHFFLLFMFALTLVVVVPIGWVAVLFGGRFPKELHGYIEGVLRWSARVSGYVYSLTDEFPPFSRAIDVGASGRGAYIPSAAIGLLVTGGAVSLIATLVILTPGDVMVEVSYERLLTGELVPGETHLQVDSAEDQFESEAATGTVELTAAADPADELVPLLVPQLGYRLVQFELTMENQSYDELEHDQSSFRLKDEDGDSHRPVLAVVGGRIQGWEVDQGEAALAVIVFELPEGVDPLEFRFNIGHHVHRTVIYRFR